MFTLQISYLVRKNEAFKKVFDPQPAQPRAPGLFACSGYRGPEQRGRAP